MGWASGSEILEDIARTVMPKLRASDRPKVAKKLVELFMDSDCDTINEVEQKDIQKAYDKLYPPDNDEE